MPRLHRDLCVRREGARREAWQQEQRTQVPVVGSLGIFKKSSRRWKEEMQEKEEEADGEQPGGGGAGLGGPHGQC